MKKIVKREKRKNVRLPELLLVCLLLCAFSLVSCGTEKPGSTGDSSHTEKTADTENTSADVPSQGTDTEQSIISAVPETVRNVFGHPAPEDVVLINQKTLAEPSAMLYDISVTPEIYNSKRVREMISSYRFPDTVYFGNEEVTDDLKQKLLRARNMTTIPEYGRLIVRFAVLTENADLRSFPTDLRAVNELSDTAFDMFQETKLPYGSGVWILHESEDGEWYFVIGENYYGWIRRSACGFCDMKTYASYVNREHFLVEIHPVSADPLSRLGVILPCEKTGENRYMVTVPERDDVGRLVLAEKEIDNADGRFSEGFLPWSEESLFELADRMLGTGYGWADEHNLYDCSSTIGLLYRCFGFYLPRNTSIMNFSGLETLDMRLLSAEDKYALMEEHPGAILLMSGHAMLYRGKTEAGHQVLHNTTYKGLNSTVVTNLEEMYNASGTNYTELLTYIIFK